MGPRKPSASAENVLPLSSGYISAPDFSGLFDLVAERAVHSEYEVKIFDLRIAGGPKT